MAQAFSFSKKLLLILVLLVSNSVHATSPAPQKILTEQPAPTPPTTNVVQPFTRYDVSFFGSGPNSNSENGGLQFNTALMNLNCAQGFQTINLANGKTFMTVPTTNTYYLYMGAMTQNQNGGSGEWNNVQFVMYAIPPGQSPKQVCTFTTNQRGGESNNGQGYSYFNDSNGGTCPPIVLSAGTQLSVQTSVVSSGTHCSGNSVLLLSGSMAIQTMPF